MQREGGRGRRECRGREGGDEVIKTVCTLTCSPPAQHSPATFTHRDSCFPRWLKIVKTGLIH